MIYRYFEEFKALMREIVSKHEKELRTYFDFVKQLSKNKQDIEIIKKAEKEYLAG